MNANNAYEVIDNIPQEVIASCQKITMWMEMNGKKGWLVSGVCDRRIAYKVEELEQKLEVAQEALANIAAVAKFTGRAYKIALEALEKLRGEA